MPWVASTATPSGFLGLPVSILDVGATGLLVITVWMILTGRLTPKRTVDDLREEIKYWRAAHREIQEQNAELARTGRVTQQVLRAVEDVTTTGGGDER